MDKAPTEYHKNTCVSSLLVALLMLLCVLPANAGGGHVWEEWFDDLVTTEEWTDDSRELVYEQLCYLEERPFNINTVTRDELEQLPFLTETQVSDILEYIYRHESMATLSELNLIGSLDVRRRRLLRCFVYAGEAESDSRSSLAEELRYGDGEITGSLRLPTYNRRGDRNGYLGYKYKHWLRATFNGGERLRAALSASQDAGELFFSGKNSLGYDFYSFFVELKQLGPVERLVLGHYAVAFGMGLVANTGFSLGKTSVLASLGRAPAGIRGTASRSSASYLQGAASTVRLSDVFRLSAFASYRPHDATLNSDDGTVATIVTSGYHRTVTEMGKKNNTHSATAGLNAQLTAGAFQAGLTAVYTHYDRDLRPKTSAIYRRHYAAGNDFANFGLNYGYTAHAFSIRGETAVDRKGHLAAIHSLNVSLPASINLMLLHRFYSYKYTSVLANSFSEGGRVQNENGIYLGIDWRVTQALSLKAYADYASFAWPRYRISWPSSASDNMVSATYSARRWTLTARYRLHFKQRDNEAKTGLYTITDHKLRLMFTQNTGGKWTFRTQADLARCINKQAYNGLMIGENVGLRLGWIDISLFAGYFNTDGYDSRLYTYERGLMYSFSSSAYYGHGVRGSLMARANVGGRLTLLAKCGVTAYFDRSVISSSYQQVDASSMTDIDVQASWRF